MALILKDMSCKKLRLDKQQKTTGTKERGPAKVILFSFVHVLCQKFNFGMFAPYYTATVHNRSILGHDKVSK